MDPNTAYRMMTEHYVAKDYSLAVIAECSTIIRKCKAFVQD